ncbi:MAG: flagellar basal body P-ring formation chaperone FlgA [Bdellovibrionales bacterium]
MNRPLNIVTAFLLALIILGFASPCAAATLRGATEVNRSVVKLSDVFDQLPEGVDADIARAPLPGKSITYDANVLRHLAAQYKLNWKPSGMSDYITITTACVKITADDVRAAVLEKIRLLDIRGDIEVAFDNRLLEITLPADKPINFMLNNFNYEAANKRFRADLMAEGFSGPINMPVMGHLISRRRVPVLSHRVEAGTIIGAADIDWITVTEDRAGGAITAAEELVGREAKRALASGQVIKENDIMLPRMVVRGTTVTMKIQTPVMVVTATGRAMQDGRAGDVVRVMNTHSNRMIEGVVEGAGTVRIHTPQKLASAEADTAQAPVQ